MRSDHHAFQRAARVAGFGLMLQLAMGLTLLLFGLLSGDTAFLFGSLYVLLGIAVWVSLIIVFFQHKLERLEALEQDEIDAGRGESSSVFDEDADEVRVAGRRLRLMHRWLMPIVSMLLVLALGLLAWSMIDHLIDVRDTTATFERTPLKGWGVSLCLAVASVSFIFSRFVAGMAKLKVWQNLRGGAGYMVGNALVTLAIAVGLAFRFFQNDEVIYYITFAIPVFMLVVAAEILLNFILNIYRPRVIGEVPRPAFDSRLLSLVSTPDSIVRTINEAVNYQFGFDITSSWGYQLLLRSVAWLVAIAVVVFVGLNMMVVVEPHQQAVKLAGGEIVGDDVYGSGVLWKLPWPLQTAEVYDVTRVRSLPLTAQERFDEFKVSMWEGDLETDIAIEPFIVAASRVVIDADVQDRLDATDNLTDSVADSQLDDPIEIDERTVESFALVDTVISLHYRIKSTKTGGDEDGLLSYLRFAPDSRRPREQLTIRENALKSLAMREISTEFARLTLDEVLVGGEAQRAGLVDRLESAVQQAFDEHNTGVEVIALNIPVIRPSGAVGKNYVDLMIAMQQRRELVAEADQARITTLTFRAGSLDNAEAILEAISEWDSLKIEHGMNGPETVSKRIEIEQMLKDSGGEAISRIIQAERDRWVQIMAAKAQISKVIGELPAYSVAPELYRERAIMSVLTRSLGGVRKFFVGTDPSRFNLDLEYKELDTVFGIAPQTDEAIAEQGGMGP